MIHLEWHQHAFLDESNRAFSVIVFHETAHNHQLLEDIRLSLEAAKIVCCCQFGIPRIGDIWDEQNKTWINTEIIPEDPDVVLE